MNALSSLNSSMKSLKCACTWLRESSLASGSGASTLREYTDCWSISAIDKGSSDSQCRLGQCLSSMSAVYYLRVTRNSRVKWFSKKGSSADVRAFSAKPCKRAYDTLSSQPRRVLLLCICLQIFIVLTRNYRPYCTISMRSCLWVVYFYVGAPPSVHELPTPPP